MPKRESQKVKGCKKCGRSAKKGKDQNLSLYVKGFITATEYFRNTNQKVKA